MYFFCWKLISVSCWHHEHTATCSRHRRTSLCRSFNFILMDMRHFIDWFGLDCPCCTRWFRDVMHVRCARDVNHQMSRPLAGGAGVVCQLTMTDWYGRRRQGTTTTSTSALPPAPRSIALSLRQSHQQHFRAAARANTAAAQAVARLSVQWLWKEAETYCGGWGDRCFIQHKCECSHLQVFGKNDCTSLTCS